METLLMYSTAVRTGGPTASQAADGLDSTPPTLLVHCGGCGAPAGISCPGGRDHPERIQLAYHNGLL